MMIITPEEISAHELLKPNGELSMSALAPDPGIELPRADGLHLSTVLKALGIAAGVMKDYDAIPEENELLVDSSVLPSGKKAFVINWMMLLGLAWESWLFRRVKGVEWQPGEIERDNIFMNPDGVEYGVTWRGTGAWHGKVVPAALHECKVTWQSTETCNQDIGWYRKAQIMGYCRGLDLWDVDNGELAFAVVWMLHLNGNYRETRFATLRRYWCEMQPGEVVGNWKAVLAQAEKMR